METGRAFLRRTAVMMAGVIGMGICLSLLLKAGYGVDSSSFMNSSIASYLGSDLGPVMLAVNIVLFIPELIAGRSQIGIGTIANMTLIGFISDFFTMLEDRFLSPSLFTGQPYRVIVFASSLALFLVSAALYMNAGLGQAPYDAVPTIISSRTGLPFFIVRMVWDFSAIAIGLIAGGRLPVGTVILAFTIGPAVSWIGRRMEAILFREEGEQKQCSG